MSERVSSLFGVVQKRQLGPLLLSLARSLVVCRAFSSSSPGVILHSRCSALLRLQLARNFISSSFFKSAAAAVSGRKKERREIHAARPQPLARSLVRSRDCLPAPPRRRRRRWFTRFVVAVVVGLHFPKSPPSASVSLSVCLSVLAWARGRPRDPSLPRPSTRVCAVPKCGSFEALCGPRSPPFLPSFLRSGEWRYHLIAPPPSAFLQLNHHRLVVAVYFPFGLPIC